jgi:hypothetical protein
MRVEMKDA